MRDGPDGQTVNWTEYWLNGQAQRVLLSGTESGWRPVTSSAPHETILGPVLLSTFINEPDDGAEYTSSKSAEKMGEVADALVGCAVTQSNNKRPKKWADGKLMEVTKKKYKVLHVVKNCKVIHQCIVSIVPLEIFFGRRPVGSNIFLKVIRSNNVLLL